MYGLSYLAKEESLHCGIPLLFGVQPKFQLNMHLTGSAGNSCKNKVAPELWIKQTEKYMKKNSKLEKNALLCLGFKAFIERQQGLQQAAKRREIHVEKR